MEKQKSKCIHAEETEKGEGSCGLALESLAIIEGNLMESQN